MMGGLPAARPLTDLPGRNRYRGSWEECASAIPDPISGELICRLAVLRALSYGWLAYISARHDRSSGFGGWDGHTRRTEAGAQESNERAL